MKPNRQNQQNTNKIDIYPHSGGRSVSEYQLKQLYFDGFEFSSDSTETLRKYKQLIDTNDYQLLSHSPIDKNTWEFVMGSKSRKERVIYWVRSGKKAIGPTGAKVKPSFQKILRFWQLFPFILPAKTRREAYEPAYNDLKADYITALQLKSPYEKAWVSFCFTMRTVAMVLDCFRVLAGEKFRKIIWNTISESYRKISGG